MLINNARVRVNRFDQRFQLLQHLVRLDGFWTEPRTAARRFKVQNDSQVALTQNRFRHTLLVRVIGMQAGRYQARQGVAYFQCNLICKVNCLGARIDPLVFDLDEPTCVSRRIDHIDSLRAPKCAVELIAIVRPCVVLARQAPSRKSEGQPILRNGVFNHGHATPPQP